MTKYDSFLLSRRDLLRRGGLAIAGAAAAAAVLGNNDAEAQLAFNLQGNLSCVGQGVIEEYPMSPLLGAYVDSGGVVRGNGFTQPLPIPLPLKPSDPRTWNDGLPLPSPSLQSSDGNAHSIWPNKLGLPEPLYYHIDVKPAAHSYSKLLALPINNSGQYTSTTPRALPDSCMFTFNGQFPGAMINNRYGQPALVRFKNCLDELYHPDYSHMDPCDFGDPNLGFLTHLHNAHTAPESDGNPNNNPEPVQPGQYIDNMYLNYPAGNDQNEKQSFLWFHDHRMDQTGANVYKGMAGLFPIYDPYLNRDNGDETKGWRLPGVPNLTTGGVDYDIPLAVADVALDDGVVRHMDFHNGCGESHPEWWGKAFYRHFPNHGFVGDIFTVNGVAQPVLTVKRRRYRFRFLDAAIARIFNLKMMTGVPLPVPGQKGQYNLFNRADPKSSKGGTQCMKLTQIATDGGLLPFPIIRDSVELWPGKRREFIVDFSKYMDGTPTKKGDVMYLTNTLPMSTGRAPDVAAAEYAAANGGYAVPMLKIIIGDDAVDNSIEPVEYIKGKMQLRLDTKTKLPLLKMRDLPTLPNLTGLRTRTFELQRGGAFGGEIQWLINGLPFEPTNPMAIPRLNTGEIWIIRNGGGGWVHPMHLHMEEHQILSRNGVPAPDALHPDDRSREDVIGLLPGEEVRLFRRFRTFKGKYVAHCHNLAHEDHAMMFGWEIA